MCLGFSHSQSVCGGRVNPLPCLDTNSDGPTDQQQKQKQAHNNVYFHDLVFLCMKICRRRLMEVLTRLLTRYHFHSPCIAKCLIPCDRQTLLCCRTHQPHQFRSQTTNFLCLIRIPRHNLFTFVPDGKYRLKAWTLRSV